MDNSFALVVATLFGCVNNFYLGAVVSVLCPPMLRLLSAAPCPHHRVPATLLHSLPARRKRPIETHRCDSSVLCCLNSITQQIMMIMIEVLVPNNLGHVFIGLLLSPLPTFQEKQQQLFEREAEKSLLSWSFARKLVIHYSRGQQKHVYLS